MRKTLLLLWWTDGGRMVVERNTLAWQGRQWLRAYERVGVKLYNPFYGCHMHPFIHQGVTTMANQSLCTD